MIVRRVVYRAIFPLAVVLPVWVLIGRGIIADGIGWAFVAYLFISPVLFLALMVTGGLIAARPDVREQKAVSWADAAVLIALWLTLIAVGLYAYPALAVLALLLVLGLFWLAIWELLRETGRRFQRLADDLQAASQPNGQGRPRQQPPLDIGEVIVVTSHEVDPPEKHSQTHPPKPQTP